MILLRTNMGSHIKAVRRRVLGDSVGDFKEHGVEMPSFPYFLSDKAAPKRKVARSNRVANRD